MYVLPDETRLDEFVETAKLTEEEDGRYILYMYHLKDGDDSNYTEIEKETTSMFLYALENGNPIAKDLFKHFYGIEYNEASN
ncbi:hypothetical protein IW150_005242 [Coemansia sp. RSA 2607]|nr:hypothetical protein IW150_005242 [Coemansia sp. RSA 2607]KAJ2388473.1 hypothetical protein GGI05_003778 [Coemansia sp. RSA 2603]